MKETYLLFLGLCTSVSVSAGQPHIESAHKVIACAYPKEPESKAAACQSLNDSEHRIMKCATKSVNGSRLPNCKNLSDTELKAVPIIDAHRPRGTTFDLSNVRKKWGNDN